MARRKTTPLPPDTGIPTKIEFCVSYSARGKHKQIDGTVTVPDGSASVAMCLNSIWPNLADQVPDVHEAESLTLTATRLR